MFSDTFESFDDEYLSPPKKTSTKASKRAVY